MLIDLRSDTFTKPTAPMLEAMMNAEVGDDVFAEDPTVNALQEKGAAMFGMEAALFCPSGTMTNQIAIAVQNRAGDEVICDKLSHIYNYEGGGIAVNARASVRLVEGENGLIDPSQVGININPRLDAHYAMSNMLAIENTCNKGGGTIYKLDRIAALSKVAKEHNLKFHLDGARVFNALVETGEDATQYGKYFDSISICLSKGLGAPIGSLLLGSKDLIVQAHRKRKMMGGGMRQAGYIAAAGLYALENNVERLKEDHARARQIKDVLLKAHYVNEVKPVETNILIFSLNDNVEPAKFIDALDQQGIKAINFGGQLVRFVLHLDITQAMTDKVCEVLSELSI